MGATAQGTDPGRQGVVAETRWGQKTVGRGGRSPNLTPWTLLLLGLALLGAACGGSPAVDDSVAGPGSEAATQAATENDGSKPVDPASVVLISIDTLRSDHVGAYGGTVATPHLDALAADGVVFERAYSHVPMTLPSHLSALTGLLPPRHGVRDNIGYRPATETLPYVPKRLQDAGYATAAAVSAYVLQGEGGLALGFDVYDDELPGARSGGESGASVQRRGAGGVQRPGGETLRTLTPWLDARADADGPFFLFVHLFEPHTPYAPPSPFAERYGAASYAGEVAAADALVGSLVQELRRRGLYEDAAVLVFSDHGEGLGDHGEDEHGLLLYRESLQVPLLLKLPAARWAGRRVAQPVGLVDVAPTLLELAGMSATVDGTTLDGVSLLDALTAAPDVAAGESRPVYAETFYPRLHFGWSELTSLIAGDHHYIEGPRAELYDVLQDPAETRDLVAEERAMAARLRDRLAAMAGDAEPPGAISEADRRALAALGYVSGGGNADADGPLPHPRDQLASVAVIRDCLRHYQEGRLGEAATACRQAVDQHPRSLDAWEHLARSLLEGRRPGAHEALEQSLELAVGRAPHLALAAATLLLEQQRPAESLELLQRERILAPEDLSLRLMEARTLVVTGDVATGLARAQDIVEERPDHADAVYLRGAIRIGGGDLDGAEADLRRALDLAPDHTAALSDLATLLAHRGRRGEAEALFHRLLELRPNDPAAREGLRRLSRRGATP